MDIELAYEDFTTALDFLFGTLSPAEKNTLLHFGLEKQSIGPEHIDQW